MGKIWVELLVDLLNFRIVMNKVSSDSLGELQRCGARNDYDGTKVLEELLQA